MKDDVPFHTDAERLGGVHVLLWPGCGHGRDRGLGLKELCPGEMTVRYKKKWIGWSEGWDKEQSVRE